MAREPNRSFGDDDATGGCMDCAWLGWVRRYGFVRDSYGGGGGGGRTGQGKGWE